MRRCRIPSGIRASKSARWRTCQSGMRSSGWDSIKLCGTPQLQTIFRSPQSLSADGNRPACRNVRREQRMRARAKTGVSLHAGRTVSQASWHGVLQKILYHLAVLPVEFHAKRESVRSA